MTTDLALRRTVFVYEAARLVAIMAEAPVIPAPWDDRPFEFREQMVERVERACQEGLGTTEQEHESWMRAYEAMGWTYGETYDAKGKRHPDLVPYSQLGRRERDKDEVFIALVGIARAYIYDLKETP